MTDPAPPIRLTDRKRAAIIEAAVDEFGLAYPILLDNNYETWGRFANRAWPSKYLIDAEGYIVYDRWALNPHGIDSARRVYLPIDGLYIIQVSDYANALAACSIHNYLSMYISDNRWPNGFIHAIRL